MTTLRRPVTIEQRDESAATTVRVRALDGAEVWVRVTHGGRKLSVYVGEGEGRTSVEWSIAKRDGTWTQSR